MKELRSFIHWQDLVMRRDLAMRRRLITLLVIVLIALLLALLFFFWQSGGGRVSHAQLLAASALSPTNGSTVGQRSST